MAGNYVDFGGLQVDINQFDFNDHSNRVGDVRTANVILIILVVSILSLRLFARAKYVKRFFADDGKYCWRKFHRKVYLTRASSYRISSTVHNRSCINMHRRYVLRSLDQPKLTLETATGQGLGTHIWLFPIANIFQRVKACILVGAATIV